MPVRLRDILNLDIVRDAEFLAGSGGIDRIVNRIATIEKPFSEHLTYSWNVAQEGDLYISKLFVFKNAAEKLREEIQFMIATKSSGLIVNRENPVDDLSMEELRKIFAGEILSWSELGGPDRPIVLISRESGSGTRDAFDEMVGLMEDGRSTLYVKGALFCDSTNSVSQNVLDKTNAIGYVSLGSLTEDVKPLTLDGVVCNEENIRSGRYILSRPFDLLVNTQRWNETGILPEAHAFIDFVLSEGAQPYILEKGFIPAG